VRAIAVATCLTVVTAGAALAGDAGQVILDEASPFRCHTTWRTPVVRAGEGVKPAPGVKRVTDTALPPQAWAAPDFDDASWSRWKGAFIRTAGRGRPCPNSSKYDFGVGSYPWRPFEDTVSPYLALLCMRGRFQVDAPSAMKLSVTYRGGVVVRVNGTEVGRGHLPEGGNVALDALAEDYPEKAHLGTNGKPFHFYRSGWRHVGGAERMPLRLRTLENVTVPSSVLRRGVNVLALEFHRSAHHRKKGAANWGTCGPVKLDLRAGSGVRPNVSRPKGVQVWNGSTAVRNSPTDWGDPLEPLKPVTIVGARNGIFNGKVVVSADGPLKGVTATASDLSLAGGEGTMPASAVTVLYAVRDDRNGRGNYRTPLGFWDTLVETPPAEVRLGREGTETLGAILPIVIKVRVPAEAKPGDYRGRLRVNIGGARPVDVPVHLRVIDWRLPDPRDYVTHVALVQSPESVALQYGVPLWSERHWALLEQSFRLLGEVGNRSVCIPLICRTNFGNAESMVRWIKQPGGGYTHDFSVFDRYLDLARKHLRLDVVCLYGWDLYCGRLSWGKTRVSGGTGPKVSLLDPATGTVQEMEGPTFDSPEARAFWAPVCEGIRARLRTRGLLSAMMLGISGENRFPTPEPVQMFKELLPEARWVYNGHPNWRTKSIHGMPIGYSTAVYVSLFPPPGPRDPQIKRTWQNATKCDVFPRSGPGIGPLYPNRPLEQHRAYLEATILCYSSYHRAHYDGLGRVGADFWPVINGRATLTARYPESGWKQLDMRAATEALLAPGPDGAVTTERFEMLREGVQECEARIFIEKALDDPAKRATLGADLAKRCQDILDERVRLLRAACISRGWAWHATLAQPLSEKLFAAAAAVADSG